MATVHGSNQHSRFLNQLINQKTFATMSKKVQNLNEFSEPTMNESTSKMLTTTLTTTAAPDEFADPRYLDQNARLPRIQALRGATPDLCGYFLSTEEMAKSGWIDFEPFAEQLVTYTFESSGQQEQGLLIKEPRMLVCPRTPLLAFDRTATTETEQLTILGTWKREYKEDENVGNCQMYEVLLLDVNNRPLHTVPLSYVAKGANHASFSVEWQKLVDAVTACHAIESGIAARPKNNQFNSLCVFAFTVARELVGKKQKSPACRVVSHESPTMENWKQYFVGYDATLKKQVWDGLQPTLPMLKPGETTEVPALPASVEE
jgi:hypothetical protein